MPEEKYLSPQGYHVETLEVFPAGGDGFAALVVQYNEDKDAHRSQANLCLDFESNQIDALCDIHHWIYSMWRSPTDQTYIIHSGGTLERGRGSNFEVVLTSEIELTKLVGVSDDQIFVIGRDGFIGLFDGEALNDVSPENATDIYSISVAPDGATFACGGGGGLWQLNGGTWDQIEMPTNADLHFVLAESADKVMICGEKGLCGQVANGELSLFEADGERAYYCIERFRGAYYFGAGFFGLDKLEGDDIVPFKDIAYAFNIASSSDHLFTSGLNRIGRFDGTGWMKQDFV